MLRNKTLGKNPELHSTDLEGRDLIHWLNEDKENPAQRRIIEILSDLQELSKILEPQDMTSLTDSFPGPCKEGRLLVPRKAQQHRYDTLLKKINNRLRRYRVFAQLAFPVEFGWSVRWYADWHARHRGDYIFVPSTEGEAALVIVALAKDALLDRIRNCKFCGTWFYARFKHQEFCQTGCQQKHYAANPEWQAHRRKYMRRYRRIKSLPNVK